MSGLQIEAVACLLRARIAPILLGGALLAAACSTVPSREWPPFDQRTVRATFRTDGAPIELPASSADLTVIELVIEPAPAAEQWVGGRRRVVPPAGCSELHVRCVYRAYARDGALPSPQQVFVGATAVEDVAP